MSGQTRRFVLAGLVCVLVTGCGEPAPLKISAKQPHYAPWCGPNERVQFGQRVVGHVHDGPKHRDFLVDDAGQEHDPEKIADAAWTYLERSGEARKIQERFVNDAQQTTMPVVSVNPVVVILVTYPDPSWQGKPRDFGHERWFWPAQIQPNSDPRYHEGLMWFSPELKQKPTKLVFSEAGVAEIVLPNGKLKLVREGDQCKTERE
ncbi:MAG TPA: hypothetical protein VL475_00875 [Planctomycetaceae bacterium]|jgi:hypothetical protein|nr:hypothetical protein [Planctomycetaceae bacterium]